MNANIDLRTFEATPGINVMLLPDAPVFTQMAVSNDFIRATGVKREDVTGTGFFATMSTSAEPASMVEQTLRTSFANVITNKVPDEIPMLRDVLHHADGTSANRYWRVSNAPVLSDAGDVLYIIHSATDITEYVTSPQDAVSQQSVLQDEANFSLLVEQSPFAIDILKGDALVFDIVNPRMLELLGKTKEQILNKPLLEVFPEAGEQGFDELLRKTLTTGERFEAREHPVTLNRNGKPETLYVNFIYEPYREADGSISGVISVAVDVTEQVNERRKAEEAQKETERQKRLYETITSNTPDLIYVFTLDYHFAYANEALLTMWGTTWETSIGKGLRELGYEEWHATMHEREIDQVAATKKSVRGEVSFPHAVLGTRIYDYIFVPVLNEHGEVEAVAGTTRDITEIKMAEEMMKENELVLQQKVEERTAELERTVEELKRSNANLEQFAYAASHDMKEPVRKMRFFADRLHGELKDTLTEKQTEYLTRLERASFRMGTLIDDLLSYSQVARGITQVEEVDLNKKLQLVLEDLDLELQELQAHICVGDMPIIKGNKRQIQQLFQNIIGNAIKYHKPGVAPEVQISSTQVLGKDVHPDLSAEDGNTEYCFIEIKDNGIGFQQEYAERIFNVFTRLHGNAEYNGTGVGLSIAQRVVKNHGGHIWAESKEGEGAVFKILLPAVVSEIVDRK